MIIFIEIDTDMKKGRSKKTFPATTILSDGQRTYDIINVAVPETLLVEQKVFLYMSYIFLRGFRDLGYILINNTQTT